ncbi:hypothetical protein OROGR_018536 [Orobanche gracilis]
MVFATTPSIFTASADGSRHVKFALWITASGNFKSMVIRIFLGTEPEYYSHFVHGDWNQMVKRIGATSALYCN